MKATATLRKDGNTWDVTIYSQYENYEEAAAGVARFCETYKGTAIEVVKTEII